MKFPVIGEKYNPGDWKLYASHTEKEIKGFFGEFRFLSNFHVCHVVFENILFPSSEAAYMAAKTKDMGLRERFVLTNPKESKKLGRSIALRPNWDNLRLDVMFLIVYDKFYRNADIRQKLLKTGDKYLEETNHWKDMFYGVDYYSEIGENNLGKILMRVRSLFQ